MFSPVKWYMLFAVTKTLYVMYLGIHGETKFWAARGISKWIWIIGDPKTSHAWSVDSKRWTANITRPIMMMVDHRRADQSVYSLDDSNKTQRRENRVKRDGWFAEQHHQFIDNNNSNNINHSRNEQNDENGSDNREINKSLCINIYIPYIYEDLELKIYKVWRGLHAWGINNCEISRGGILHITWNVIYVKSFQWNILSLFTPFTNGA